MFVDEDCVDSRSDVDDLRTHDSLCMARVDTCDTKDVVV